MQRKETEKIRADALENWQWGQFIYESSENPSNHDLKTAVKVFQNAISHISKIPNSQRKIVDLQCLSSCYFYLGGIFNELNEPQKSLNAFISCLDNLLTLKSMHKFDTVELGFEGICYGLVAGAHRVKGHTREAIEYFTKAIEHFEQYLALFQRYMTLRDSDIARIEIAKYVYAVCLVKAAELKGEQGSEVYKKAIEILGNPTDQEAADFLARITNKLSLLNQPATVSTKKRKAEAVMDIGGTQNHHSANSNRLFKSTQQNKRQKLDVVEDVSSGISLRSGRRIGH